LSYLITNFSILKRKNFLPTRLSRYPDNMYCRRVQCLWNRRKYVLHERNCRILLGIVVYNSSLKNIG